MKKVIVGLSGGVDSSVSAVLLKKQGYDVHGIFMVNWENEDDRDYCSHYDDLTFVKQICGTIGIPYTTVNFAQQYWDNVFDYFLTEYQAGRTPNPDILCNQEIKFKAFYDYAQKLGADFLATGHYARTLKTQGHPSTVLAKGLDNNKDQSYFLYAISKHVLPNILFPCGELIKNQVRQIAQDNHLINHDRKDSTGICFIGERRFKTFLNEYLPAQPGIIRSCCGKNIGRHDGLMFYTLGQRKGLGIGGQKGFDERPWYVVAKDLSHNELVVTQQDNHPMNLSHTASFNRANWLGEPPTLGKEYHGKVRYRQADQACTIERIEGDTVKVRFNKAQRAVTPGQSLVLYQDDICLGGGIITHTNSPGGLITR